MALTKQYSNHKPVVKQECGQQQQQQPQQQYERKVVIANNENNIVNNKVNNHIELRASDNKQQQYEKQQLQLLHLKQQQEQQQAQRQKVREEEQKQQDNCANKRVIGEPEVSSAEKEAEQQQQQEKQNQQQEQQVVDEISLPKKIVIDCLLYLIQAIITLFDYISQPIYYFKHEVHKKQHEIDQVERSSQIDPQDPNSPWRQIKIDANQTAIESRIDSFSTYDEMMKKSFEQSGDSLCYGYRQIVREQWSKRPESDKLFRQVELSDFKWVTYNQFNCQIEAARRGFLLEGIRAGDKVMLYADTRPEWQIATQALIRLGAVVGTMYSTLGVDGIVHSVNETQVTHVVSQKDKVSKLLRLKPKLPKLKKIIYFDPVLQLTPELGGTTNNTTTTSTSPPDTISTTSNKLTSTEGSEKKPLNGDSDEFSNSKGKQQSGDRSADKWPKDFEHSEVECMSFGQLLERGQNVDENDRVNMAELEEECKRCCAQRTKDSIAVIMYTSGSTGIPKGVLISHRNIMATVKSFSYVTKDFVNRPKENTCTAYLPLAHIFEFCIESVMLFHGVKYGFATPHTLTDKSPGLMPGQVGDLNLLKPTVMIIVPLILDRIVQGVKQALNQQSYFKAQLISYLINYKMYWQRKHYETPLIDRLICSKIAMALGGRAKYVICGSAPLSGETQTFVRAALNLKLPQGFGTTETCAATACQLFDDQSTCNVGLPVAGAMIKLEPWLEGNYRPSDKPNPRGEIVVGGEMIAHGYFNLDEQTKEAFYVDDNGVRWYRTGDIGEFLPNGNLKIIDRKKDLVKLQNGEYISLGKVESTLKSNPYTDNFCVYANSNHNYVVALGPANELAVRKLAQQIVDEHMRKSPSLVARNEERKHLLMSDDEQQAAVEELQEVLASYESDRLNNNEENETNNGYENRKMSSLSTQSADQCINERLNKLCENKLVQERVLSYVRKIAQERNLMTMEIPKRFLMLAEEWTEDKNLVTAAMKIRRNYIYKRYEHELAQLYSPQVGA